MLVWFVWVEPAVADVPDVVLTAAVGHEVEIDLGVGAPSRGRLEAFDHDFVSLVFATGEIAGIPREPIVSVRLAVPAPAAAPAPFDPEPEPDVAPAPVLAAEPALSAGRALVIRRADKRENAATTLAVVGLGTGLVGGIAGTLGDEPWVVYTGGLGVGFVAGFGQASAGARRMAGSPGVSDAQVAARYRTAGALNLFVAAPVFAGLGGIGSWLTANAASDGDYYPNVFISGTGYAGAFGYVCSGIFNYAQAGRAGRAESLARAWVVPPRDGAPPTLGVTWSL
jgi:hypothetical protein